MYVMWFFLNIKYILCLNIGWILTFSAHYLDTVPPKLNLFLLLLFIIIEK